MSNYRGAINSIPYRYRSPYVAAREIIVTGTTDPYAANVVLFLKGDGTNGSTSIIDSSLSPKTITRVGDTQISTAQFKYNSSIYFDGSGDYLTSPTNTDFEFGSGDFTIETWIYPINFNSVDGGFIALGAQSGSASWILRGTNAGLISFTYWTAPTTAASFSTASGVLPLNQWNHVAVTRQGTSLRMFHNGILVASRTDTFTLANTDRPIQISYGFSSLSARFQQCYQDSLRLTKGVARYTANFNPETDTYLNV